jgi:hypothetical protein
MPEYNLWADEIYFNYLFFPSNEQYPLYSKRKIRNDKNNHIQIFKNLPDIVVFPPN